MPVSLAAESLVITREVRREAKGIESWPLGPSRAALQLFDFGNVQTYDEAMLRNVLLIAALFVPPCAATDSAAHGDVRELMREGASLSAAEVEALEAQLQDDPLNMSVRTKLLGYYSDISHDREPSLRARLRALVLWLIHNEPKSAVLQELGREFSPYEDPDGYVEGKGAFLAHLEKEPNDLILLEHTADFLSLQDRPLAIELLKRGQDLDSSNPKWALELAFKYFLEIRGRSGASKVESARKALNEYEKAYALMDTEVSPYGLKYAAETALLANDYDKAREFADLMLGDTRPGWNYGNNIHYGNVTLGKIALAEGDVKGAASYLLLAGSTPGSPQLNSFGPDTELAKKLLEEGERETVLRYFHQCEKFWEMGQEQLREWTILVRAGTVPKSPDFGR